MANKVGTLIKEARTAAKLTQEELGAKVGLSASEIGKAERGEKELTQAVLKQIAKATGVTQTSLIEAAKQSDYGKTGTAKKTETAKKKEDDFKLTATEKKLIELYREAGSDTKKKVTSILKGESTGAEDILGTLLGSAMDFLGKK